MLGQKTATGSQSEACPCLVTGFRKLEKAKCIARVFPAVLAKIIGILLVEVWRLGWRYF